MAIKQICCKHCKAKGYVARCKELCYARCTKCTKWNPYEFLGATPDGAIKLWNEYNTKYLSNAEARNI